MASGACDLCGKTPIWGNHIRHKHSGRWERKAPKKGRQLNPNVHKQRIMLMGQSVRANVCTRCLRTLVKSA